MQEEDWGHYRPNLLVLICMKVCNSGLTPDGIRAALLRYIESRQSIYDIYLGSIKYRWHVDDKKARRMLLGA
jgi:hypothetical protein